MKTQTKKKMRYICSLNWNHHSIQQWNWVASNCRGYRSPTANYWTFWEFNHFKLIFLTVSWYVGWVWITWCRCRWIPNEYINSCLVLVFDFNYIDSAFVPQLIDWCNGRILQLEMGKQRAIRQNVTLQDVCWFSKLYHFW